MSIHLASKELSRWTAICYLAKIKNRPRLPRQTKGGRRLRTGEFTVSVFVNRWWRALVLLLPCLLHLR